jgi:hypothetical protein
MARELAQIDERYYNDKLEEALAQMREEAQNNPAPV